MREIPTDYVENVHTALGYLETFLTGSEFVANNQLSIADICLLATVTSIEAFFPITSEKYPNITNWMRRLQKEDFYSENIDGLEKFKYIFKKSLSGELLLM